jgi:hypothetical protein
MITNPGVLFKGEYSHLEAKPNPLILSPILKGPWNVLKSNPMHGGTEIRDRTHFEKILV